MAQALFRFSRPLHHRQRPALRSARDRALGTRAAECSPHGSASPGCEAQDRDGKRAADLRYSSLIDRTVSRVTETTSAERAASLVKSGLRVHRLCKIRPGGYTGPGDL